MNQNKNDTIEYYEALYHTVKLDLKAKIRFEDFQRKIIDLLSNKIDKLLDYIDCIDKKLECYSKESKSERWKILLKYAKEARDDLKIKNKYLNDALNELDKHINHIDYLKGEISELENRIYELEEDPKEEINILIKNIKNIGILIAEDENFFIDDQIKDIISSMNQKNN